ncbi:MAG: hypothetical protein IJF33_00895 [Clostridia bacterium]|nr:hypothetical protein [Clostridia bacterium]
MKRITTTRVTAQGMRVLWFLLALLLVLAGCNETNPPVETELAEESSSIEEISAEEVEICESLPIELDRKIRESYAKTLKAPTKYTAEDIHIEYIVGYQGFHVMFLHGNWGFFPTYSGEAVEDILFIYPNSNESLRVYREESDSFSTLKSAYQKKWLTYDEMVWIQRQYAESWCGWTEYQKKMVEYGDLIRMRENLTKQVE